MREECKGPGTRRGPFFHAPQRRRDHPYALDSVNVLLVRDFAKFG